MDNSDFWRDPALPYVESRRACASRACYRSHHHPTYSIGAVDAGHSIFAAAGHAPVALQAGTVVFIPPQRVHACNPAPGTAWSYQMLHIEAGWLEQLRHESSGIDPAALAPEPVRVIHHGPTYQRFTALNQLLFSACSAAEKEAALIEFLGDNQFEAPLALLPPTLTAHQTAPLEKVRALLAQDLASVPALEQLASLAGMSRYQLIRCFRLYTGLPPHAWHLNQRINQARADLRAGYPLADVAYRLGFADQSHFQRIFKAHTGVTPSNYRA